MYPGWRRIDDEQRLIEFGPQHERLSTAACRERVEQRIRALVYGNPVLLRVQQGEAVSDEELVGLAELLEGQDPYITEKLLQRIYDNKKAHFIQFLRHILGLEPLGTWTEEVTSAFDGFIGEHSDMTELQVRFLVTLRTFILQAGKFEKADLIHPPFTRIHPQGVRGIFGVHEIDEILHFSKNILH